MGRQKVRVVESVSVKCKPSFPRNRKLLESPFLWLVETKRLSYSVNHTEMIERLKCQSPCCSQKYRRFERFITEICLMYEYFCLPNEQAACRKIKDIENEFMLGLQNQTDDFYNSICEAIYHIIIGSQMFLFPDKDVGNLLKVSRRMFPVETTLSDTRAAVFGIKACYFALYGCNGMVESLVSVGIAIDLSAEPYWLYVKSYCLAMIRRNDRPLYGSPNVEEIKLLENALRRSNDLLYVIVTANRLLETAKILRRVYYDTNQWETIAILVDKLYYKSGCMFTDALSAPYNNPETWLQCAQGFMDIPGEDVSVIKRLIESALKQVPDHGFGHFLAGKFCELFSNEFNRARHHYTIAIKNRIFEAGLRMLHIDCFMPGTHTVDVIGRLAQVNKFEFDVSYQIEILCQIVSYYMLIKNDLHFAVTYMREIMSVKPHCEQAQYHKSLFVTMTHSMSLYDIVVNAIYLRKKECVCSDTELALLGEFLHCVGMMNIPISALPEDTIDLRVQILDDAGLSEQEFINKYSLKQVSGEYRNVLQELKEKPDSSMGGSIHFRSEANRIKGNKDRKHPNYVRQK